MTNRTKWDCKNGRWIDEDEDGGHSTKRSSDANAAASSSYSSYTGERPGFVYKQGPAGYGYYKEDSSAFFSKLTYRLQTYANKYIKLKMDESHTFEPALKRALQNHFFSAHSSVLKIMKQVFNLQTVGSYTMGMVVFDDETTESIYRGRKLFYNSHYPLPREECFFDITIRPSCTLEAALKDEFQSKVCDDDNSRLWERLVRLPTILGISVCRYVSQSSINRDRMQYPTILDLTAKNYPTLFADGVDGAQYRLVGIQYISHVESDGYVKCNGLVYSVQEELQAATLGWKPYWRTFEHLSDLDNCRSAGGWGGPLPEEPVFLLYQQISPVPIMIAEELTCRMAPFMVRAMREAAKAKAEEKELMQLATEAAKQKLESYRLQEAKLEEKEIQRRMVDADADCRSYHLRHGENLIGQIQETNGKKKEKEAEEALIKKAKKDAESKRIQEAHAKKELLRAQKEHESEIHRKKKEEEEAEARQIQLQKRLEDARMMESKRLELAHKALIERKAEAESRLKSEQEYSERRRREHDLLLQAARSEKSAQKKAQRKANKEAKRAPIPFVDKQVMSIGTEEVGEGSKVQSKVEIYESKVEMHGCEGHEAEAHKAKEVHQAEIEDIKELFAVTSLMENPKDSTEIESTIGGQTSCIICMSNEKTHLAVPCGHQCVCEACSQKAQVQRKCPYCCQDVMMWVQQRIV